MLIFTAASHSHTEGCVLSGSHHISLREIPPTCLGPDSLPWNAEVELKTGGPKGARDRIVIFPDENRSRSLTPPLS